MSGGHFNCYYHHISSVADSIDDLVRTNNDSSRDEYGQTYGMFFSKDTIDKFKETSKALRLVSAMVKEVDYLVSGDTNEETFMENWTENIEPRK